METGKKGFRSAFVGGFNRKDVLKFFETFSKENNEKIAALTTELELLEKENAKLAAEKAALSEKLEQVRNESSEQLQISNEKLAEEERKSADLRKQIAELEPLAHRYEALKDRVATVELEAHRKAEVLVADANKEAAAVRVEMTAWLNEVGTKYNELHEQIRCYVAAVGKAENDFSDLSDKYAELMSRGTEEK